MAQLEPTYLRNIFDGLINGSIHPENAAELPIGLIGMYEQAFDERSSVIDRQNLLQRFAIWALLKKEVSVTFVAEILNESEVDIQQFIFTYSAWFNSPESGKFQLYHERLKVYLLQKLNQKMFNEMNNNILLKLHKKKQNFEINQFKKDWIAYYLIFSGEVKQALKYLNKNNISQIESSWVVTFDLYCTIIFLDDFYEIDNSDIVFFENLKDIRNCDKVSKIILKKFKFIDWDSIKETSHETRFHYALAQVLESFLTELPSELVEKMIISESHYLSYVIAYAWKYNSWKNDVVLFTHLIPIIQTTGSPYLRILLHQIDGGRKMVGKTELLPEPYKVDCWEYVAEDFLDFIEVGKNSILEKYLKNKILNNDLLEQGLSNILLDFEYLHIKIDFLKSLSAKIEKSNQFYSIIEILWIHPAWEIGEVANEIIRNKLKTIKDESLMDEIKSWIYNATLNHSVYSLSILLFDIIEVANPSVSYTDTLVDQILYKNGAQARGQFLASLNDFISVNKDKKWLKYFMSKLILFCDVASDIWETQEFISLINELGGRLNNKEKENYYSSHAIIKMIPRGEKMDWITFWKTAEDLRLNSNI